MLETVIFDMDGVIVDSEPLHHAAYHAMFDEVGISVPRELYQSLTGRSTINLCTDLKSKFQLPQPAEELVAIKRKHFDTIFHEEPTFDLIPGVRELISHYRSHDMKLVLASSSSMGGINRIFDRFDLHHYFVGKISGADLKESKPHPEIFLRAAARADSEPGSCMVIEDAKSGVQAAKAAGMFCVGYDSSNTRGQDLSEADLITDDFSSLYLPKVQPYFA